MPSLNKQITALLTLGLCLFLPLQAMASNMASDSAQPVYDYPIDNPFAATIIGTPPDFKKKFKKQAEPEERKIVIFPERKIPEGFWYYDGLTYGQLLQKTEAPLVFVIGGTGSGYKSAYSVRMAKTLYNAGYHVITLPSTTHSNFIVSASENFYPGNGAADAEDLYRVMRAIKHRLDHSIKITSTNLTGYSLGGWQAAFVGQLDEMAGRKIGFNKILVINTPLNLSSSLLRLDAMLLAGLPGGIDGLDAFLNRAIERFSTMKDDSDAFDFRNENMLWESYKQLRPSNESMQTTIGLIFRFSAANMIFTTDIMSHAGYIYPKDKPFYSSTPLSHYMAVALRAGLSDYFRDIYSSYYLSKRQGLTHANLVEESDLRSLRSWIRSNPNIAFIGNRDDIVLGAGEIDILEGIFAGKSHIFPTGGHLGNLDHPSVVWQITNFFNEGVQK